MTKLTIIESIYAEPEKWHQEEYYMVHKSGAKVWTANSTFGYRPYPGGEWSWKTRRAFHKARMWWIENSPVEAWGNSRA